jgi:hypothetical protein
MTTIQSLAGQLWVQHRGWSLVQFLWQGTMIAFLFAIVRAMLRNRIGAQARYAMACGTLGLMVATPFLTFLARLGSTSQFAWRGTAADAGRTCLNSPRIRCRCQASPWREFSATDHVAAFARVYEGGSSPIQAVDVTVRLTSDHDLVISDSTRKIAPERFRADRSADVEFALPVDRLAAGSYLLSYTTNLDKTTANRSVRFAIR